MRRLVAASLALLLLAGVPVAAEGEGAAAGWRVALTINNALANPEKDFEAFDTASLNLFDFNGDGQLEIVSHNDNNRAYVIDSRSGTVLAEIETYHFNNTRWPVRELNPIAIGDLYGDDVPCLVIPNSASYMSAWCYDHAESTTTSFAFDKKWEILVDAAEYEDDFWETHPWMDEKEDNPSMDGHAYLGDADKDGDMEVFVETDGYPGQFSFDTDGEYIWSTSWADGNAGAKVLDLDDDGRKEAVFVSDGGLVTCYDADTGKVEWNFDTRKHGGYPGSIPVSPVFADLEGDGKIEIMFGARGVYPDQEDPDWIRKSHAMYYAIDHRGKMLWNASYDWMNPLQYNHPAAADVNDDGVLDGVFLDWNTIGHKPGDWETTGRPANLFALNGRDGSVLWTEPIHVFWSNKDFVIADADGDGDHDIIAPTARGSEDGLGIYSLRTGERKGWIGFPWQASRGPVAGDLYGDGQLRLVVPIAKSVKDRPNYRSLDVGLREGALVVIETGRAYDAWFSANFLHSEDQGTLLQPPTPVTPPPTTTTVPPPTSTTPPTATTPPSTTPPPSSTTPPTATTPPANTTTTTTTTTTSTPPPTTTTSTTTTTTTTSTPPTVTLPTSTTTPPPTTTAEPTEATEEVPGAGIVLGLAALAAAGVLRTRKPPKP